MRRKARLTESDINRIVTETLKNSINEIQGQTQSQNAPWNDEAQNNWNNNASWNQYQQRANYTRNYLLRTIQTISKACNAYLQNNDETALSTLYWYCSSFAKEYDKYKKNSMNIYK